MTARVVAALLLLAAVPGRGLAEPAAAPPAAGVSPPTAFDLRGQAPAQPSAPLKVVRLAPAEGGTDAALLAALVEQRAELAALKRQVDVLARAVAVLPAIACRPVPAVTSPTAAKTLAPVGPAAHSASVSASVAAAPRSYVVQPGDTLSTIAERLGVSQSALMALNGLQHPDLLEVATRLALP